MAGTVHWVCAAEAIEAEIRLYDVLFSPEDADEVPQGVDWKQTMNPHSRTVLRGCKLEPSLAAARHGDRFQFERMGYFCVDSKDSTSTHLVFNRTVTLKDAWAKIAQKTR